MNTILKINTLFIISMIISSCYLIDINGYDYGYMRAAHDIDINVRQCTDTLFYLISEDFSEEHRALIVEAFDYWNNIFIEHGKDHKEMFIDGGSTQLLIGANGPVDRSGFIGVYFDYEVHKDEFSIDSHASAIAYVKYTNECIQSADVAINHYHSVISRDVYSVPEEIKNDLFRRTIMHEIGHTLGFTNTEPESNLMNMFSYIEDAKLGLSSWEIEMFKVCY